MINDATDEPSKRIGFTTPGSRFCWELLYVRSYNFLIKNLLFSFGANDVIPIHDDLHHDLDDLL